MAIFDLQNIVLFVIHETCIPKQAASHFDHHSSVTIVRAVADILTIAVPSHETTDAIQSSMILMTANL
jgi:hypothetical protein